MIYPIYIYGEGVLAKKAEPISRDYPELDKLISDMFETMDNAHGVGLAAPQIGKSLRLFTADASALQEDYPEEQLEGFRLAFINPQIISRSEETWKFEEGCLSIPGIRESVQRPSWITMRYQNTDFQEVEEKFDGIKARIIQHEYDHVEGILFTDIISPLKKSLLSSKLIALKKGKVNAKYPVRSSIKKRG